MSVLATEGTRRGKPRGNMHLPGALIRFHADLDLGNYEIPEMDGDLNVLRFRFNSHPNVRIIILYCIVLYCAVLYCTVLYCIVLYCIVLYCIVLYCIVLYCIVLSRVVSYRSVSYRIVLYCIVLYCSVLDCITHITLMS